MRTRMSSNVQNFGKNWLDNPLGRNEPACDPRVEKPLVVSDWQSIFTSLLGQLRTISEERAQRTSQAVQIRAIEMLIAKIEPVGLSVLLTTLAPENLKLSASIPVVIQFNGDDYIASFFDANIHASGDTDQEAFDGLRERVIEVFKILDSHDPAKLGPEPKKQLAVLRSLISRA